MTAKDMSGTARCIDCRAEAEHERGPGSPLSIRHFAWCPQIVKVHELAKEAWWEKAAERMFHNGICSCGAESGKLSTSGMVDGWFADHVNRFPMLTKAIVIASSMASRDFKRGDLTIARHYFDDAKKMAQELRMRAIEPRRDAEELALALFDRAAVLFASPEEPPDCPG